jgi:cytochrome oxidase assembly protein ShyY1
MNATQYTITAYALGLGLLWGYAARLWRSYRSMPQRNGDRS